MYWLKRLYRTQYSTYTMPRRRQWTSKANQAQATVAEAEEMACQRRKLSPIRSSHKTLVLLIQSFCLLLVALINSPHMMIHPISLHLNLLVVNPLARRDIPVMKILFLASNWWILDQYLALNGQRNATETVISTLKYSAIFVINRHH